MAVTYEKISSQTLTSQASSITFSSIPQTYTDIVVSASFIAVSGGSNSVSMRFNSDTGTNYNLIYVGADDGGSAVAGRSTNVTAVGNTYGNAQSGRFPVFWSHIFQYANTSVNKNVLNRNGWGNVWTYFFMGQWRSTSAITTISFHPASGQTDFATGSEVTLYGIKAA